MSADILTLNAGSSSIKFALYAAGAAPALRAKGQVEGIGVAPRLKARAADGAVLADAPYEAGGGHDTALERIMALIAQAFPGATVAAVGHRVVHGGPDFAAPVRVDAAVLAKLETYAPFAPLHQPHNLAAVRAAMAAFPDAAQVACFDTAFHRGQPWVSDTFALPRRFHAEGVRRYGFHGLSYDFVSRELARRDPERGRGRAIICHLGAGASLCAIEEGRAMGSTMGFTALDGLPMATRCGQIDPGVLLYLMTERGMDANAISDLLYGESGLKGLSGISSDMRALEASDAPEAREAVDYFTHRVRREIGGLAAVLGGLDALVFTAGIGENSATVRAAVCADLGWMGVALDAEANAAGAAVISAADAPVRVYVIATDEERVIAEAAIRFA
ncbi:MAG: acetate/propionate family kinase [Rhodobacteraceae bacterium]|nr:MAG: acetate/propionate family kinase [Paracoccaceae bacterium]